MKIRRNIILQPGTHRVRLDSIQEKETMYGERLMWWWEELKTGAEVVGFTSRSSSEMAKAYKWAVALNPDIAHRTSWEFEDVSGQECLLRIEVVQRSKGPKNNIIEVLPLPQDEH